jgi:hypothetical protein
MRGAKMKTKKNQQRSVVPEKRKQQKYEGIVKSKITKKWEN